MPCGGTLLQVEPPQNDLRDPCSETITLIFHDLLISLVVLGLLFPKMYNGICKRLFWLAFTFFQHQHSPICQLCNHWHIFEPMNSPLVLQSPFKWTIWALGGNRPSSVDSASFLATESRIIPILGSKELSIPLRISHPTSARHQVLTRKSLLCKARNVTNLRLWFLPTPTSSTEVRYQA